VLYTVIIAGGRGERFWPKSRRSFPKQFLRLFGKKSLIELTYERIKSFCPLIRQRYVIPSDLVRPLRKAMPGLKKNNVIAEPVGKNTALAIGLAAACIIREDPNAVLVVLSADHLITDTGRFCKGVEFARSLAKEGYLVTFGIPPSRPETGYGYIRAGKELRTKNGMTAFAAEGFTEKPSPERAREYLNLGNYFWNSGMFVWTGKAILEAIDRYLPELGRSLARFQPHIGTRQEQSTLKRLYQKAQSISIDYGVMEQAENIAVVRADFDWDDVGSWVALERHHEKNLDNNTIFGKYLGIDTKDSIIWAENGMVATLGIRDMLVVKAGEVVLVCPKARAQDVKKLIERLVKNNDKEFL
jgi:mannose-1-phosphate guanylyltransferase